MTDNGVLYVVEFDDGGIKVGRTRYPQNVETRYIKDAKRFHVKVTRHWVGDEHAGVTSNETTLKRWCASRGTPRTGIKSGRGSAPSEWYDDLQFDEAVEKASSLTRDSEPPQITQHQPFEITIDLKNMIISIDHDHVIIELDMTEPTWVPLLIFTLNNKIGIPPEIIIGNVISPLLKKLVAQAAGSDHIFVISTEPKENA